MNALRTLGRTVGAFAVALILNPAPGVLAQADDPDAYGDGYRTGDYGRVRYADGGVLVLRASSDDDREERAGANAPLFPGDALRTASGERVEIELSAGSIVRVDRDTRVTLQSLPTPYAKYRDNTVLTLDRGSLRIAARVEQDDEFRIDTPSGAVYLLGDGDFRIDADADRTHVASRRGVAEVVGEGGSVLVRGGMHTNAFRGIVPEDPRAFTSYSADPFDRWVAAREDAYRGRERVADDGEVAELPDEVEPYYRELSSYGNWVVLPTYGTVWYPTALSVGWRPYSDGYWHYGPHGYFWVSNEPWGWAPYRYGRWNWLAGYGWCWIPGRVYAGAWVSWSWGSAYYGWAPLDYWGYPAHYGGHLHHGYYDPGCWTFVNHHHMAHHDVQRYAVPVDRVPREELDRHRVVTRPPSVPPRRLAESAEWRDRAARAAAGEPTARRTTPSGERASTRGFREVEDRLARRASAGSERRENAARAERAERVERVERPRPSVRENPARTVESPKYPRRVVEDPRARVEPRRGTPAPREEAAPSRPQAPREPRAVDRERRTLYDRVSRPRDVREGETRRSTPEAAPRVQPRETPREQPRPAPRVAPPRQEPRREQAQPPKPAPRPESPRPAPRPEPRREPAKPKKDDGGGGGGKRGGR